MAESKQSSLEPETAYELLAHPHRRRVLSSLEPGERRSVADVVDDIVTRERPGAAGGIDLSVRRRIRIELVHNHLPRLDHHDVVDYTHRSKTVELTVPIDADDEEAVATALLERAFGTE